MNAAVVVAAGRGTRMGAGMNKVLLPVCGVPVIVRSVRALWESGLFDGGIVVVTGEEDRERIGRLLEEAGLRAVLCTGGADRQESVRRGLAALPRETELVAIHDGARPLVTRGVLAASLESAGTRGSGVAAIPLKDTVKRVEADGIPVVYVIEMSTQAVAKTVAEETGCRILTMHSAQTVTQDEFDAGETYVSLMRRNVEALEEGLN